MKNLSALNKNYKDFFADTRDTLCYATNDNQQSTYALLETDADLAIIVGGYNSSNTSHIKELCDERFTSYFINGADEIKSMSTIHHFNYEEKKHLISESFLPTNRLVKIVLTSGASCPDSVVDEVLEKILGYFPEARSKEEVLSEVLD